MSPRESGGYWKCRWRVGVLFVLCVSCCVLQSDEELTLVLELLVR